ncbi:hypothetical protein GCM10020000_49580 [Streptomyces olivoverticillatus]
MVTAVHAVMPVRTLRSHTGSLAAAQSVGGPLSLGRSVGTDRPTAISSDVWLCAESTPRALPYPSPYADPWTPPGDPASFGPRDSGLAVDLPDFLPLLRRSGVAGCGQMMKVPCVV